MSDAFLKRFGNVERPSREEIRAFLKHPEPERDSKGNIMYVTEQAHKDNCDINKIMRKYATMGVVEHVNNIEAAHGNLTGDDFKSMMDKIVGIQAEFNELPSELRKRFTNDPAKLLTYLDDPKNTEEAIKIGLLKYKNKTEPTP